jgi:hypothetical protein
MLVEKQYMFQSDRVRDLNMAEPESHTLHLLREIREDIRRVERKIDRLQKTANGLTETVAGRPARSTAAQLNATFTADSGNSCPKQR